MSENGKNHKIYLENEGDCITICVRRGKQPAQKRAYKTELNQSDTNQPGTSAASKRKNFAKRIKTVKTEQHSEIVVPEEEVDHDEYEEVFGAGTPDSINGMFSKPPMNSTFTVSSGRRFGQNSSSRHSNTFHISDTDISDDIDSSGVSSTSGRINSSRRSIRSMGGKRQVGVPHAMNTSRRSINRSIRRKRLLSVPNALRMNTSNRSNTSSSGINSSRSDPMNTTDYNFVPPRHSTFIGPMLGTIDHDSFTDERNTTNQEEPITTREEEAVVYKNVLPSLYDLDFLEEYREELEQKAEVFGPEEELEYPPLRNTSKSRKKFMKNMLNDNDNNNCYCSK